MRVTFWGVRGSFPVAHPKVTRVGGNTSCVAVEAPGEPLMVLDAGTGFRNLGRKLKQGSAFADGAGEGAVLFSHTHWDHIQGFMYFEPFFRQGNKFTVVARAEHDKQLREVFQGVAERPYFPFQLDAFKAKVEWKAVQEQESFALSGWKITTVRLNHPGFALGYKLEAQGKTVLYLSDTAPYSDQLLGAGFHVRKPDTDPDALEKLRVYGKQLEEFCRGADVLVYDTFFTPEQYKANPHWGHSTAEEGVRIARATGVPRMFLFHHNPEAWDDDLEGRGKMIKTKLGGSDLAIDVAREGMSVEV